MNKRNLDYVRTWNSPSAIALAKDKYKSKEFYAERSIPVPKTYALIQSYDELLRHDFSTHPTDFVVKPNKGSKGHGIMIVHQTQESGTQQESIRNPLLYWWDRLSDRYYQAVYPRLSESVQYFRVSGTVYDEREFKYACARILQGSYSLTKGNDAILVEEKLLPGKEYALFCVWGLADVRVIVFNRIPIAAMVRIPTEASGGRANIAQGGIACSINIATGKIDRLWSDNTVYDVDSFPEEYCHFAHYQVPFWHEVLIYSSMIQYFSDLGYMGIDWVIGEDGPVLLEVNARPGLEIQNVTGIGLDGMMKKVSDLTVYTPQKGVEIATSLFSPHEHASVAKHKHLYLSQAGLVSGISSDGETVEKDIIITLSIDKKYTAISPALQELLNNLSSPRLSTGSIMIQKYFSQYRVDDSLHGYQVRLGTIALQGFSIKPHHTMKYDRSLFVDDAMQGDDYTELQLLDKKLHNVARQFSLSKILQPLNYLEEFHRFVDAHGSYNPQFHYDFPSKKKLTARDLELKSIGAQYRGSQQFVSPFGQMLYDYMDELHDKLGLIQAYKYQDPDAIREYNERLYGAFDSDRVEYAMDIMRQHDDVVTRTKAHSSLSGQELLLYIRTYLDERGLHQVKVIVDPTLSARIAVRLGSKAKVVLSPRASFDPQAIDATLAHEIDVHVVRYLNGKASGRQILKRGTAGYLPTEEGLAIHAAEKIYRQSEPDYINIPIYQKYILSSQGMMSFEHMYDFLRGWERNNIKSHSQMYRTILRQKKGVQDTGDELLLGWNKGKIYLDGYLMLQELSVEKKQQLMGGKIGYQYIDILS